MHEFAVEDWLGRVETAEQTLNMSQVARIAATLGQPLPAPGEALPALWHWAFFQCPLPEGCLGEDGHPVREGLLPAPANRSRMWAGGRVWWHAPLHTAAPATRTSRVIDVQNKAGGSGALLFVTVQHEYHQQGRLCISEEQDIVYRQPAPPRLSSDKPLPGGDWREPIAPTPALLFRYSAVTFNSHRIHYDEPYATGTEGYPGLVVQGPLIATLSMAAFCRANPQARPRYFAFRGLRPLIAPHRFEVGGQLTGPGTAATWAGSANGLAQASEIHFDRIS